MFATHFPSLSHGADIINTNVHMFAEDIQLAVMPIGGRTEKRKEFGVALEGSASASAKAENIIRGFARYERYYFNEMVCDAIGEIVQKLAWEGCATYEILKDEEDDYQLISFTSKRLWKLPLWYLQIIPRGDWEFWKKKWVAIPAKRIWYIEMPLTLGGRRGYEKVLKDLGRFEHLGPRFWREDLNRGVRGHFDLQHYARGTEIYYAKVTRDWGWNRRDWSQERCTEFFTYYKLIRSRWAQAVLREHVIEELNKLFERLQIPSKLVVSGLPTSAEILKLGRNLEEGKLSFGAVSDQVRW